MVWSVLFLLKTASDKSLESVGERGERERKTNETVQSTTDRYI